MDQVFDAFWLFFLVFVTGCIVYIILLRKQYDIEIGSRYYWGIVGRGPFYVRGRTVGWGGGSGSYPGRQTP